jgi:WhiB family redox-sensing transcriptional regulator
MTPDQLAEAACADHPNREWWFPTRGESHLDAVAVCEQCPVREPCLEYALVNRIDHGVWGGKSERARRRLRKGRTDLPTRRPLQQQIEQLLVRSERPLAVHVIRDAFDDNQPNAVNAALSQMVKSGRVERVERGYYRAVAS